MQLAIDPKLKRFIVSYSYLGDIDQMLYMRVLHANDIEEAEKIARRLYNDYIWNVEEEFTTCGTI